MANSLLSRITEQIIRLKASGLCFGRAGESAMVLKNEPPQPRLSDPIIRSARGQQIRSCSWQHTGTRAIDGPVVALIDYMNAHWIYTVTGGLVVAAIVAWPISQQDARNLTDRIRFCLLTIFGVVLLIWGFQQQPGGLNGALSWRAVGGLVIGLMATAFLLLLWFDKILGLVTDLVLGCLDFPEDPSWDSHCESRQIEQAVHLFRRGRRRRALRLCNRIIASNSQYAATATTLAHWIENPGTLRFHRPPRTSVRFNGRFPGAYGLWTL